MKKIIVSTLILGLLLSGCSLFQSESKKLFLDAKAQLLIEGSHLNALTEQGVSFAEFGNQLGKTKGIYDLAISLWPENYLPSAKENLGKAFEGWRLTYILWDLKINQEDYPAPPDVNHYQEFVDFAGDNLSYREITDTKKVIGYANTGILMTLASQYFEEAQNEIIEDMK